MRELSLGEIAAMSRQQAEEEIRARVQTVYLGNRRVLTRVLGRQKIYLSTDDIGFAGHVMLDGYWEMWLTQFFARIVQPGMTVIDVGANAGYYSILFGDAVGASGRVIAVEPIPQTCELLRRSVLLNGYGATTRIVNAALGSEASGEVHMLVPENEPKNAAVVGAATAHTIAVPATTLDALAADLNRIDLIKIDAEGAEEDIVAGMDGVIQRHKPNVLLEFNARRSKDPVSFLASLHKDFVKISALDFDAELKPVTDKQLLDTSSGEDVLLYCEARR